MFYGPSPPLLSAPGLSDSFPQRFEAFLRVPSPLGSRQSKSQRSPEDPIRRRAIGRHASATRQRRDTGQTSSTKHIDHGHRVCRQALRLLAITTAYYRRDSSPGNMIVPSSPVQCPPLRLQCTPPPHLHQGTRLSNIVCLRWSSGARDDDLGRCVHVTKGLFQAPPTAHSAVLLEWYRPSYW